MCRTLAILGRLAVYEWTLEESIIQPRLPFDIEQGRRRLTYSFTPRRGQIIDQIGESSRMHLKCPSGHSR